jgi:hypothetical protein
MVEVYWRFGETYCLHFHGLKSCLSCWLLGVFFDLEDGRSVFLRNAESSIRLYGVTSRRWWPPHCISVTKPSRLMLFMETVAVGQYVQAGGTYSKVSTQLRRLGTDLPPQRPLTLGQVFSEYSGFPCQFSFSSKPTSGRLHQLDPVDPSHRAGIAQSI